jgi:hypothetical protein
VAAYNNWINAQGRQGWITNFDSFFWSGSSVSYNANYAWIVNLADGYTHNYYKDNTFQVVCVTNPDAPTAVTGTAGKTEVALSWSAPANTGGSAITNYSIQYSSNGGNDWSEATWSEAISTGSTSTTHTVTGLTNGTAYVFRVAAVNALGTGSYSGPSASVTPVPWTDVTDVTVGSEITMRDNATGLWWSNYATDFWWSNDMGWDTAMSHCGNLSYNGEGAGSWRVPTKDELVAAFNNGINTQGRQGWITDFDYLFWSGSSASGTGRAWVVNLANLNTGYNLKDDTYRVVCVR